MPDTIEEMHSIADALRGYAQASAACGPVQGQEYVLGLLEQRLRALADDLEMEERKARTQLEDSVRKRSSAIKASSA